VATERVSVELFHVANHAGTNRIQVDVTHQLQQIGVLLAQNRFVTILEEHAVSTATAVESYSVAGQQPSHHKRYGNKTRAQEQMYVIAHQCPSIAGCG
jgi:hypothetical protein